MAKLKSDTPASLKTCIQAKIALQEAVALNKFKKLMSTHGAKLKFVAHGKYIISFGTRI